MATNTKPGFQMQSRFGRYCDQRYQFLMHQDDTSTTSRQLLKRSSLSRKQKLTPRTLEKMLAGLNPQETERTQKPKQGRSESHTGVFRVQSRDEFYQSTRGKNEAPPVGYYHPNFSPVDPLQPALDFSKFAFKRAKVGSKRPPAEPIAISATIGNSAETHMTTKDQTEQPFARQLPRPPLTAQASPVSEKRFESVIEPPPISTKTRRVRSPDLKKTLARSYWKFLDCQNAPEYEPDYERIRPRLYRNIDFEKFLQRRSVARSKSDGVKEDVCYSQIRPTVKSPNFQKTTSRPPSAGTPLPTFMRQMNSRLGLTVPNDKTLQMNNYAEAGFFVPPTSFSRPASPSKPRTSGSRAISPSPIVAR